MGAWGPGIFSDDDACDIREDVRDFVADGLSPPEIERRILDEYAPPGTDAYRAAVARIAIALRLHKFGRLDAGIRDRAIAVIDDGSAVGEWFGHGEERKRRAALQKAREQLLSPQPPAKKVSKPRVLECPWDAGDLVSYQLQSGALLVFVVRAVHDDKGGTYPTIELIWSGKKLPTDDILLTAPLIRARREWVLTFNKNYPPDKPVSDMLSDICLLWIPNKTPARFRSLGLRRDVQPRLATGNAVLFKKFDAYLEEVFGLS
jgi:hypothetical protein